MFQVMPTTCLSNFSATARTLSAPRIRDVRLPHEIIPQELKSQIMSHYKDLTWEKQKKLSIGLSKNSNVTIYSKPLVVPKNKMMQLIKSRNQEKIEDAIEQSFLESTAQKQYKISSVDMIMYRSLPYLYFLSNRMFHELTICDSSFKPFSMLDMGHNLGASVWAAHNFYSKSIDDFVIHEHNKSEYNRTIELLNSKYKPHIPNVRVKGAFSMPSSKNYRFDIVTAINYFPFLQDFELHQWIDKVWNQTEYYLIIADISNRYTSNRISKIRSYFINKYAHEGHIFAPCPHAMNCPMVKKNDVHGCRFFAKNVASAFAKRKMLPEDKQFLRTHAMEYSYLILKRGLKNSPSKHARILRPVIHHQKVLEFTSCNNDGTLWNAKTGLHENNVLYKHIDGCKSGDLIDQNWWLENFKPLPIGWESRSAEQQIKQRKERNKERFEKKSSVLDDAANEFIFEDDTNSGIDVSNSDRNPKESGESFNENSMWEDDHFENIDDHLDLVAATNDDDTDT